MRQLAEALFGEKRIYTNQEKRIWTITTDAVIL